MADLVELDRHDRVAVVRFNRPERGNAWTDALGDVYYSLLAECEADPKVHAIVVTGAGKSFCVGGDYAELESIADSGTVDLRRPRTPHWHTTQLRKPIIAAINGGCAGIGLVQALMCDLRFAAPTARFTTAYVQVGLPAEQGLSWVLPRVIGTSDALDLLLSGRTIDAAEAATMRLVNRVVEDVVAYTVNYAGQLAANSSPSAMAAIKRQIWTDWSRSVRDASDIADELTDFHVGNADFAEGVAARAERRPPNFEGKGADHG